MVSIREELSVNNLLEELLNDYTSIKQGVLTSMRRGEISKEVFLEDVWNHIVAHYKPSSQELVEETVELFDQYVFGYFRLTPLIDDPEISDIRCCGHKNIRIKRKGKRQDSGIQFSNAEEYKRFVDFVATKNEVNISNLNAIQRFTDNKSNPDFILRFTLSMPLINTYEEPYLCIRKVPVNFPEIRDLVNAEMMSDEVADLLVKRFRSGSTLISGGNSSGKTTLLNALKETLPDDMAVLISQQADELTQKYHPDMMFLHELSQSGESSLSYDLQDISIAGLTMDVDFFILGEIKGGEAAYVLNAAYTGQMCAATIHAPSAEKAPEKLVDYAMQNSQYSRSELLKMMSCFNTLVFMKSYRVWQIYAVNGWDEEKETIRYEILYEREGN